MTTDFFNLNIGDRFVFQGDTYVKLDEDEAKREGDSLVVCFDAGDQVQDA